jgi:hypothetical protein
MLALLGAVATLAVFGALGVAVLRRASLPLEPLEHVAFGVPLGAVLASLTLLGLSSLAGLTPILVVLVAAACAATALALRSHEGGRFMASVRALGWLPVCVLGALFLRWLLLWTGALTVDDTGLWAGHRNLWGDWAQHLGDVSSFAYGDNFPPANPRLPGSPFSYHYLTSVTAAALVKLGLEPAGALCLHSFLFSCFLALGVYAFARRLVSARGAAALALLLFFLGGGLGWWVEARAILERPWDPALQSAGNFRWLNVYFALIAPQRGWLYGLPLTLLALTLLHDAVRTRRSTGFLAAGVVAGILPLCHLPSILALAMITSVLAVAFLQRGWLLFFGTWAALAGPQLWLLQGGGAGAAGAMRFAPGWVAFPDPWLWFWIKNLGVLLPLVLAAIGWPSLTGSPSRRFLLAFQPVFVAGNLFLFQPWDWDNTKLLLYWYLAACVMAAAVLAKLWRILPSFASRSLVAAAIVSALLSGVLENLDQALGRDRHLLLTADELRLARLVRESTGTRALFACGDDHNNPIPVLSGRRVMLGYPGWLWSQGFDPTARDRDLGEILSLSPGSAPLLERYGVDYVAVGPRDQARFHGDLDGYRRRYPTVLKTATYEVFDVRPSAPAREPQAMLERGTLERDSRPDRVEEEKRPHHQ